MPLRRNLSVLFLAVCLVSACAKRFEPCSVDGFTFFSEPDTRAKTPGKYFEDEYTVINKRMEYSGAKARGQASGKARPAVLIGLGFSGGGLRSNAFQLGLLNGLHTYSSAPGKTAVLDNIAYLSTVSGGSWAAGAFEAYRSPTNSTTPSINAFFEELNKTAIKDRTLGRCAAGYMNARRNCDNIATRILNNAYTPALNEMKKSLAEGLFPGHTMREGWRELISQTHLLGKDRPIWELLNEKENRPLLIINAAHNANIATEAKSNFTFEITPLAFGTIADCGSTNYCFSKDSYYGFFKSYGSPEEPVTYPPLSISHALAMSSAVLPAKGLGRLGEMEWYLPAPNLTNSTLDMCPKTTEGDPKKQSNATVLHADGSLLRDKYMVTDGGHSENYGGLALMERDVDLVILSDGSHDPEYKFIDYETLQHHAKGLLGIDFKICDRYTPRDISQSNWSCQNKDTMPLKKQFSTVMENSDRSVRNNQKSIINAYMYNGEYTSANTANPGAKRNVIYVRPPYDISEFTKYLREQYADMRKNREKHYKERIKTAQDGYDDRLAAVKGASCLKPLLEHVSGNATAQGDIQRLYNHAVSKASAKNQQIFDYESENATDIARDLDGPVQSNATLSSRFKLCIASGEEEIKAADKKKKLLNVEVEEDRASFAKYGAGENGYMATYQYLTLNQTGFPHDETIVLDYNRELIYAYYLLGTFIGEKKLADEIDSFLKNKLEELRKKELEQQVPKPH